MSTQQRCLLLKGVDMQFKFDYTLDYKERKKAVEEYQDHVGSHNLSESEVN